MLRLRLDVVKPNPWNPFYLTHDQRQRLKQQMGLSGPEKTPPIMVRRVDDHYEIVDGEKRWSIAKELGWGHIHALEVEVDELEAITLCLSYNHLKGKIDWLKLYEAMKGNESVEKAYGRVLTREVVDQVATLGRLSADVRRYLQKAMHEGAPILLEHLQIIAGAPPEHQMQLAKITVERGASPTVLRGVIERIVTPLNEKGAPTTPTTPTPAAQPAPAPTPAAQARAEGRVVKAAEVESYVECGACGQLHLAYYDAKAKRVGLRVVRVVGGLTAYEEQTGYAKEYRFTCPHGVEGTIDVETGQVEWGTKQD